MMAYRRLTSLLVAMFLILLISDTRASDDSIVNSATAVLTEVMQIPGKAIPASMLADAQGVAIIPGTLKVGFLAGVRHGKGVMVIRDEQGAWRAPSFITLTGGSLGWQAGVQATDVVLVFKTRKSVDNLMRGKFTIGVDAAAAAGPVGRRAEAGTDVALKAELYSYSRSRGLFLGVSLDGSSLQIDHHANMAYYGPAPTTAADAPPPIPQSATRLVQTLAAYAGAPAGVPARVEGAVGVPLDAAAVKPDVTRRQLADASQQLQSLLDDHWKQFLALPADVYTADTPPNRDGLVEAVGRYASVVQDPQYRILTERPEFQSTYRLLQQYVEAISAPERTGKLSLPPPPGRRRQ